MAIKVIKHGETKFKITCPVCGCEFEYEYEDLVDSYLPGLKQIKCPDCGEWLTHKGAEPVKSLEKDLTWKFPKPGEPIPCDKPYRHYVDYNYPYVTWTSNIPDWPDCETCPNKPDPTKTIVGDTPCTWCRKNQPYCTNVGDIGTGYKIDPKTFTTTTLNSAYTSPDWSDKKSESLNFQSNYTTDIK